MTAAPAPWPAAAPADQRGGVGLVILGAGSGTRTGLDTNKVLLPLGDLHVLTWSLEWTRALPDVVRTVIVVRAVDEDTVRDLVRRDAPEREVDVVIGGASRHESEVHALRRLAPDIECGALDVVVMQDGARPLTGPRLYEAVVDTARAYGGAIPVVRRRDLVHAHDGHPTEPVVTVQTPQAFAAAPLLDAYRRAQEEGFEGTDTAATIERFTTVPVRGVPGDMRNIKITYPEELRMAQHLLDRSPWRPPQARA